MAQGRRRTRGGRQRAQRWRRHRPWRDTRRVSSSKALCAREAKIRDDDRVLQRPRLPAGATVGGEEEDVVLAVGAVPVRICVLQKVRCLRQKLVRMPQVARHLHHHHGHEEERRRLRVGYHRVSPSHQLLEVLQVGVILTTAVHVALEHRLEGPVGRQRVDVGRRVLGANGRRQARRMRQEERPFRLRAAQRAQRHGGRQRHVARAQRAVDAMATAVAEAEAADAAPAARTVIEARVRALQLRHFPLARRPSIPEVADARGRRAGWRALAERKAPTRGLGAR